MFRHHGGTRAKAGFYFNRTRWNLVALRKGDALPGTPDERYAKIPAMLLLALAPVMGGAYVVFLPIAGFAMLGVAAGTKLVDVVRKAAPERETAEAKSRGSR